MIFELSIRYIILALLTVVLRITNLTRPGRQLVVRNIRKSKMMLVAGKNHHTRQILNGKNLSYDSLPKTCS